MLKIRRSRDRLIFNMGISILVRRHLYIEAAPWIHRSHSMPPWWRHQMETFSALLAICAGNSPVPGDFPHKGQWRGVLLFSDLRLNKRLSKQSWGWVFETISRPLWRHRNDSITKRTTSNRNITRIKSFQSFYVFITLWSLTGARAAGPTINLMAVLESRQFTMPAFCENQLGLVNNCVYYARQAHAIYQVQPYLVDFKAPGELWIPLNKTALSRCSFISNKRPVNLLNNRKAQK